VITKEFLLEREISGIFGISGLAFAKNSATQNPSPASTGSANSQISAKIKFARFALKLTLVPHLNKSPHDINTTDAAQLLL